MVKYVAMKDKVKAIALSALMASGMSWAEVVTSPDGRLAVDVDVRDGRAYYSVRYDGETVLEPSSLGIVADYGDLAHGLAIAGVERSRVAEKYSVPTLKKRGEIAVDANRMVVALTNSAGRVDLEFHVSGNDVAFRYLLPKVGGRGCVRVMEENTGYAFPAGTSGFMCPQANAMIAWKRTKPSYEEEYVIDEPVETAKSRYGKGWTFPALFREGGTWVLLGETGTGANYCGCRLDEFKGRQTRIAFPMPGENNGNGTAEPAFALPGATPWRTITVGDSLAPIVETTIPWDVVKSRYPAGEYKYGRSTWSWILWMEESMNWDDQVAYIDFAAAMGYEFILVDAGWDTTKSIGRARMPELVKYAASKGVGVWLWYSSSGWWNDIDAQGPVNVMCDPIARKRDMRWMRDMGVKGIKVDFWGGDKQETFRLYEQVLSDADDNGLLVIFHGCTIPRGWERMYPNYAGSEAVLASENRYFDKHFCEAAGTNATLHPFIRNTLGLMEYGGTFLNKRMSRDNSSRHARGTTIGFELATAILFHNPVQNFALAPNNLADAPADAIEFMKAVPTTWDETRFIAGYPGKFVALARRHASKWFVAAAAAEKTVLELDLTPFGGSKEKITLEPNDGTIRVFEKR